MEKSLGEEQQRERIPTRIHASPEAGVAEIAREICALIERRRAEGRPTVLGLATGSTPVPLYRELIRLHRVEGVSFRDVMTFNLDEYYGVPRGHPESYWRFMHEQLFNHIDVPAGNIHMPDGMVARAGVFDWCRDYEQRIRQAGGLDLQILGIGRTGHIGFNEPGSGRDSRTRLVTLDATTRRDAARDFLGEDNVPRHAITMGVGTILAARRIILLAWGRSKARIVAEAIEGAVRDSLPASFLQEHPAAEVHLDAAAAGQLTRVRFPWLTGTVKWDEATTLRAVTWLAVKAEKPLLKLVDEDYSEQGLAELLTERGAAYGLNIEAFNQLQHTITGWPGGKPGTDDTHRPERAEPRTKRVVLFSPEPSDDVVGMGGTLRRLVDQGHEVTIVYQTSGSFGVPDEEAAAAVELMKEAAEVAPADGLAGGRWLERVKQQLADKKKGDVDQPEVRRLKGMVRRGEAREALQACGIASSRSRFLDLPFYENGRYRQFRPGQADVEAVAAVLEEIQPHQIFATGYSSEPGSVAAVCFEVLGRALKSQAGKPWWGQCRVWLYRDLNAQWSPAEIRMAVPLSPVELALKLQAIHRHRSQRSQRPMTRSQAGESWQQAEEVNRALARTYDRLGLAEYEAIEAFERAPLA
jgi:glucosamine-6-phosphate deaminase